MVCRDVIARQVLDDAIQALKSSIDIAIFDAANITKARRRRILDRMHGEQMYGQVREAADKSRFLGQYTIEGSREERRSAVIKPCPPMAVCTPQVIFIESIVTNPEIIESNVNETLLRSPEYRDMSQVSHRTLSVRVRVSGKHHVLAPPHADARGSQ